jgi:hypothetical protein
MSAGSDAVSVRGQGFLAVSRILSVIGHLRRVLVWLRNCLTFKIPSPVTLLIPYSANLK